MGRREIRKAVETDLQDIIRLWKRNIRTINTASDIADLFHPYKKYYLVAVYTDAGTANNGMFEGRERVIGFVGGAIRKEHGHISGVAVDREYRMNGVGKRLLKMVGAEFLADGLERITLEVRKSNRNAIRFYKKNGYKKSYDIKGYYADGEDAIVYEKTI
jgi:ribosomal-protein-alanine N-acetyltransferase